MADSITRQAVINEARRRGWGVKPATPGDEYYWIDNGAGTRKLARGARISSTANGMSIARNKLRTYAFLQHNGYSIPDFIEHTSLIESAAFMEKHHHVVVKPADSEQSKGVTVNVSDEATLLQAIEFAVGYSPSGRVVMQQQLQGKLYRLLVVGDKLFAAAFRRAAFVTGDGIHSIRELIEEKNKHPWRCGEQPTPLKQISLSSVIEYIGGEAIEEVLDKGVEKELLAIASVSLGGEAADVTEDVAPDTAALAISITKELGLSICGFDIMCPDIAKTFDGNFLPIVELNSLPGFKLHLYPTAGGVPRDPSSLVLDQAFYIDSNI